MRFGRSPRRRPRVSVIIASYRWPEALRLSLATALTQTVEDVEVLVIEDGRDTASRNVVREAADPRVRWMGLRHPAGSQSGPNAHGLRRARAPVVAYLGHDDVWHPEHLAGLLAVLDPDADVAHAVTLFIGAGDDTRLEVAGTHAWRTNAFVPPSSVGHWRERPRIGEWGAADASGMPVDYAFLMASHARGARFVTSGEPTVFKYPAAWRVDSYRTRDVRPQAELRDRLASDPGLGRRMVEEALAAGVSGDLPAPQMAPPGVIADFNRRMKGLPARFAPPLTRWTPSTFPGFPGWHGRETDAGGEFAWTARERTFVRLDAPGDGTLGVRIVVRHVARAEQLEQLEVDLDGTTVELEHAAGPLGATVLTGRLDRRSRERTVEVGLTTTLVDPRTRDPTSPDTRMLGVAVAEIELTDHLALPATSR